MCLLTKRLERGRFIWPQAATLMLWEEYATANPQAYKYTSFCVKYREFALRQQRSMRQMHIAGEKLFVDYAGSTVPVIDAATGEITQAQIFVATLGASNYTYGCATARQTTADWIGAQVQALEFIGGVTKLIVPDQTRSLIKTPDRYDPEPNRTYEEFAKHYGCVVLAARQVGRADRHGARAGRLQALGGVPAHQRQQTQAGAVALLGMRAVFKLQGPRSVTNILKCGLDRQPSLCPALEKPAIEHENVRGPDY